MSRNVQYRSVTIEVAAGVVDRKISLPHNVLAFDVPASTLNATVRFGDPGAEVVALVPGGKNKFCFETPPSAIYLTSPGGDPITVFGSQEVEPSFSPFGSDVGSLRNEVIGTWPEHGLSDQGQAVNAQMGFSSDQTALTMWGTKLGSAPDDMQLFRGRLCYEARSAAATFALRTIGGLNIHMPLTDLLTVGQEAADFSRVYWDTWWMQAEGVATTDLRAGLAYKFRNVGSAGGWESTNFFAWGLGLANDGGGNPVWHYVANRQIPGPTPDEDVDLGLAAAANWIRFDILHVAPSRTRRARLLIYADSTLVIEREWAAGAGALPDYSGVAGTILRQTICAESVLGQTLRIASVSMRRGQLQLGGSLI